MKQSKRLFSLSFPTFGVPDGSPAILNRREGPRKQPEWLQKQIESSHSKTLLLRGDDVVVRTVVNESTQKRSKAIAWFEGRTRERASLLGDRIFFLGVDEENGDAPYFVESLPKNTGKKEDGGASPDLPLPAEGGEFENLRMVISRLPWRDASLVAHAKSLSEWNESSKFCGYCGSSTACVGGGLSRSCTACKKENYPRTNPVAIMAVVSPDGERILLGQSRGRMQHIKLYSALAGFVDQGETLESAVRRETKEEGGVAVGAVRYVGSQPWPYSSNLMLGCLAQALSDEIKMDEEEMADVKWFSKDQVREAFARGPANPLEGGDAELYLPPFTAIAHHLIKLWLDEENTGIVRKILSEDPIVQLAATSHM